MNVCCRAVAQLQHHRDNAGVISLLLCKVDTLDEMQEWERDWNQKGSGARCATDEYIDQFEDADCVAMRQVVQGPALEYDIFDENMYDGESDQSCMLQILPSMGQG